MTTSTQSQAPSAGPSASSTQEDTRRPVVACQQLTKTFKDFWMRDQTRAVDTLDLVVKEREIFGLLGPNGSGKSTTIKLILGLLKPTSGRVMVFDKPTTHVQTKARIGYLPEESYLYPFLNARETLDYYGKLFKIDSVTRKKRIDELLEMVGLEHAQFRPVREYSKGMQRRIGIAQALINDPDLLILDEPTTGLDPIGTRQVKDLILELGRRGKSIILSSHLLSDVEDVVDRMVILYGGKVRGEGTCDELLSSKEKTTFETDQLDDETIAEIDELIRRKSGGEKSLLSVRHPRQKLEELFLGVVERARAERTETTGATQGGQTAAFLRSEDDGSVAGDALIDSLLTTSDPVEESTEPQVPSSETPAAQPEEDAPVSDADSGLISSLMNDDAIDPAPAAPVNDSNPASPSPDTKSEVDSSMIDSLLDSDDGSDDSKNADQENKS